MTVSLVKSIRFFGVWDTGTLYDALGFGPSRNIWAAPIVTREVLAQLIADAPGWRVRFDPKSGVAQIDTTEETGSWQAYAIITPELRCGVHAYPLESLGWTFVPADTASVRQAQEDQAWSAYEADRSGQLRLL